MERWQEVYCKLIIAFKEGLGARTGHDLNLAAEHPQCLNERHLHHWFSSYLSKREGIDVLGARHTNDLTLFPEYPTSKVGVTEFAGIWYWKKNNDGIPSYRDHEEINGGQPVGHLDFAIGQMAGAFFQPQIAIEFKLGSLFKEEVAFDYLKLLDERLAFKGAISVAVVLSNARRNCLPPPFRKTKGDNAVEIFRKSIESRGTTVAAPANRLCHFFAIDWLRGGGIDLWEFQHEFHGGDMAPFLARLEDKSQWILTSAPAPGA